MRSTSDRRRIVNDAHLDHSCPSQGLLLHFWRHNAAGNCFVCWRHNAVRDNGLFWLIVPC